MYKHRLNLLEIAASAEVVAADCRFNYWVGSEVKKSYLSERGWIKLLENVEWHQSRVFDAIQVYEVTQDDDQLRTVFNEAAAW